MRRSGTFFWCAWIWRCGEIFCYILNVEINGGFAFERCRIFVSFGGGKICCLFDVASGTLKFKLTNKS